MLVAMGHKINVTCRYFERGNCTNGKFCRFLHQSKDTLKKNTHRTQTNYFNYRRNNEFGYKSKPVYTKQCRFMENCYSFPNCGFLHKEVCKFQENCFDQQNCNFVHLNGHYFLGGTNMMNQ